MRARSHSICCTSSKRVRAAALLSFLALIPYTSADEVRRNIGSTQLASQPHTFTLRHVFHHGTYQDPDLHKRLDVHPQTEFVSVSDDREPQSASPPRLVAKSNAMHIERLSDRRHSTIHDHLQYASLTGYPRRLDPSDWTLDEIPGPNVTDKDTVINLAIMAANAYVPKAGEGEWEDVGLGFNRSASFGWEGDGLRGHIFADEKNKTIVVGLKGTSPAVFDGDGTTTRDKVNDNLFFSCCCAQGGQFFWRQVCECYDSTYTCNSTCLVKALKHKTRYYTAAMELYSNVTELYPDSNVWIVGHSLGGAVSSLLGLTYGLPVVTFEAPGDVLAAKRLGLPAPQHAYPNNPYQRAYTGAFHFGHTADPIFMGTCNGATSPCTLGGYAMESQCHTGMQCVYDTVQDNGWRVGLGYHRIHDVIDNVIRKYEKAAPCSADSECVDCFNWKFFESNGSDPRTTTTTTTSRTNTRTRTETCRTPGWWGCLDETTTSSTAVATTTFTTTTCLTPGWFGCKKEGNTTITTTTAAPTKPTSVPASTTASSQKPTTTCETPGWFGCRDELSSTTTTTSSPVTRTKSDAEEPTSCKSPGLFFGCHDKTTSPHLSRSITSPPSSSTASASATSTNPPKHKKCKRRFFFGLICLDDEDGNENKGETQFELR